jgi:hypothetical protein
VRITEAQLEAQLDEFGPEKVRIVAELCHQGVPDGVGPALVLAMGSRETNLENIVGDGGHGRGWLQIDDRFFATWLSRHAGCRSGTWRPRFASALPGGRVPTLTHSTLQAIEILHGNVAFAASRKVPPGERMRFAIAAYNAGAGNAIHALSAGDVDAKTAHGDYSADVLARRDVVARYLKRHGLPA